MEDVGHFQLLLNWYANFKFFNFENHDSKFKRNFNATNFLKSLKFAYQFTSESANAIATGNLLRLSEQNLIDCAPCWGCSGGWPVDALNYVKDKQQKQFMSESDYPFTGFDGTCQLDYSKLVGRITSIQLVNDGDENQRKERVATFGVASVCISAEYLILMNAQKSIMQLL